MTEAIVGIVLIALAAGIIVWRIYSKLSGKRTRGCSGGCGGCAYSSSCSAAHSVQALKDIEDKKHQAV